MNTFTRRKFLKSVLCGVGLTITGIHSSPLFARSQSPDKTNASSNLLLKQFEEARTLFYKKEYIQAEKLYKEMLATLPAHISIYDCYKKALAHHNRTNEIIPYYKGAIEKFPDRVDFYDHLAKTYREIVTGNKKLEKELSRQEDGNDLLQTAVGWYEKAIQRKPGKKFLYFGLLDTLCAKSFEEKSVAKQARSAVSDTELSSMSEAERQLTEPYLREWLDRKHPHTANPRARIVSGTESSIKTKILKIQNKERRPLYTTVEMESRVREIKLVTKRLNVELYKILYSKNDLPAMTTLASQVLRDNPDETYLLGKTRKYLKKAERWDLLCQLYEERIKSYKDFWTQCGRAIAYLRNGSPATAQPLLLDLSRPIKYRTGKKADMVFRGLCDCAIAFGNIPEGKKWLLKGVEALNGLGGATTALLLKYAQCLSMEGKSEVAVDLLRKRLDLSYLTSISDPMLRYIAPDMSSSPESYYLHQFYNKERKIHVEEKVSILCAIAKIQKKESDTWGVEQTCKEIEALIPSYPFVKKIKSAS